MIKCRQSSCSTKIAQKGMELLPFGSKGATFYTPGFGFYSPLSIALFSVLLHAGSHGLSVCEALKKLVRQGYSKLLNSDVHTRAVQVKSALRSCPAFKEIEGKRFVLRFNRQNDRTISPTQLCKREKVCCKKHQKSNKDCMNDEGPCDRPTTAIEGDLGVQGPCKQARIVQEEDMHLVGLCDKKMFPHIDPLTAFGSCDAATNDNICTQPLDSMMHESIERCCPLEPKDCGCIQHTSLGSLYSDCINQRGREDIKESAFALEGKDSGKVSCHVKDANGGDKLQLVRCRRTDGKRWRCPKKVQPGSIYCEHHHIMRRGGYKAKVVDAVKAGETLPSIGPSEALSGKSALREEEGLGFKPLKLANGALHGSTAQPVATSCKLFAKEELNEAQCETKPFLHTLESHNLEAAWRSKTEEKSAGSGQPVMAMAAIQEGEEERLPDVHILEEERREGNEETKQYLHRLGVDEHEDVERSRKEANLTGPGRSVTIERAIYEGQKNAKPDLNTLAKEVPKVEEEKSEHHHLMGTKASTEVLEKVVRADVGSRLQASAIPCKALIDTDVDRGERKVPVKSSRLATGPFNGSVTQVVTSSSDILAKEKFHKVHKETRPFLPILELNDLEGVQRLKKKPKLNEHGKSVLLEKHEGQEDTKPAQHVLRKLRYEVKQETTTKLRAVETHNVEDAHRPNEASTLAGHGELITPEKTVHEDQETAKVDSAVPASDGLDHMQRSLKDSMSGFYRSSIMQREVSYNTSEDGTEMYRGKGFHIEPSNLTAEMQIAAVPLSFSENPKRKVVYQGDSSPSRQALFLDGSLHVSNESQSPRVSTDAPSQCHRKDGKGWQCSRRCKPGCIYCEHHQGRLSRTSTNGTKKMILQLELDKHVLATCLKGSSETQVFRVAIDVPEALVKGLKTKVSHCSGRPPQGITADEDNITLQPGRCHRKDGKGWQCAQLCKHGSIYCDRHQRRRSKSQLPCVHSQHKLAFSRGSDVHSLEYISDIYADNKELALSAIHISNSGLERALKPQLKSQEVETRSGKQDDLGSALLSLGTPVRASHGSCLWEAKTSEQAGKAENTPKKCHRRDGKKWQCSRLCMPGYNHCEHHQGRGRKVKVKM